MIREAWALKTLFVEGSRVREDPFCDYYTGVEDATGLSDLKVSRKDSGEASGLFNEMQQALNQASALHREACFRSRAELSRYEADLRGLTEERNALKLLCGQREEEIKDLRAELAKAHQDQSDMIKQEIKISKAHGLDSGMEANISISQLQQKIELRGMKEKSSAQAKKIAELEARETLEEIHARGLDLTEEIIKAKELEADAGALASDADDDDNESKSGSKSGEKLDGEDTAPGENQEP
ncbi:uncharacterized protein [Nicotiana tomentosiformis]|uniref:uncharacterized protein n=1 Tax=Nicotiana tomentosiformis TaxID=4098 RepID=UPI00388CDE1D